jgi:hypothetical protein
VEQNGFDKRNFGRVASSNTKVLLLCLVYPGFMHINYGAMSTILWCHSELMMRETREVSSKWNYVCTLTNTICVFYVVHIKLCIVKVVSNTISFSCFLWGYFGNIKMALSVLISLSLIYRWNSSLSFLFLCHFIKNANTSYHLMKIKLQLRLVSVMNPLEYKIIAPSS